MKAKPAKAAIPTPRVAALKEFLDARPDAQGLKFSANVMMYKLAGKIFAILSMKTAYVVLKCDPDSIPMLKAKYSGVGHKTHLDRRYWIAVDIDSDVPPGEVRRLASLSYDLAREAAASKKPRKAVKKVPRARKAV